MSAATDNSLARTSALVVDRLRVSFGTDTVVADVSFRVDPGECVAIVGESGSGKSVTAKSVLGLAGPSARVTATTVTYGGTDLLTASARRLRGIRGREIGFVSQGALVALDPLRPVGREIADPLRLHSGLSAAARQLRVVELLRQVGVPEPELRATQRPDELSGGLRQRALIASAIALGPGLLIADEPTTALDTTVQAGILDLLSSLASQGTGILLISHDLAVVSRLASRILVMRGGSIVESGTREQVLEDPQHPYTRRLIAAVPAGRARGTRLVTELPAATGAEPAAPGVTYATRALVTEQISPAVASGPAVASEPAVASGRVIESEPAVTSGLAVASGPVIAGVGLTKRFGGRVAVNDVSFEVAPGRTLGIVGESGSGKTTLARLVLGLERPDAGEVLLDSRSWSSHTERERRPRRRALGAIYQDPLSSFDPRLTVGQILADALSNGRSMSAGPHAVHALEQVGLSGDLVNRWPRTLSGGQQQRVAIARAVAAGPKIIVCDEPVSSLDVSVQAQVLDLLDDLQQQFGLSYLFISHDLGVVQHSSDDVIVMHDGRIIERGATADVFARPEHPYTQALLESVPRLR